MDAKKCAPPYDSGGTRWTLNIRGEAERSPNREHNRSGEHLNG